MEKEFEKNEYPIFRLFKDKCALVTAGTMDHFNTCVIGWGALGNIWDHKPTAIIFVHPSRYTSEFLKKNDFFTLSFFEEKYKKALAYLGTHSGRDGNKVKISGLTPVSLGNSVTFQESSETMLCRKLYFHQMDKNSLAGDIKAYYAKGAKMYQNITPDGTEDPWETHYEIIGEVEEVKGRMEL